MGKNDSATSAAARQKLPSFPPFHQQQGREINDLMKWARLTGLAPPLL
jgi:hypothetical protein